MAAAPFVTAFLTLNFHKENKINYMKTQEKYLSNRHAVATGETIRNRIHEVNFQLRTVNSLEC